jgi:hypothetical protein
LTPVNELTLPELADEYAIVRQRMMAWKPNVNPDAQRFSALANELLERHAKRPAEERIIVEGEAYKIPISPREVKRTIIKPVALWRYLKKRGERKILAWYKITLGALDKAIPDEEERAKYVKEERTGSREIGEPVMKQAQQVQEKAA